MDTTIIKWKFRSFFCRQRAENTANTEPVLRFAKYDSLLELLFKQFQKRFYDFVTLEHQFAQFSAPFPFDVAKAEGSLQIETLEMQSDSEVKILVSFSYLHDKYKNFRKFATKIMAIFVSSREWVGEQLFSFWKLTKTSQSTWLADLSLQAIPGQNRKCTDISARHIKNCQRNEVSSLRQNTRNDCIVANKFWVLKRWIFVQCIGFI